jgi:CheY-like chemotaxis protein
MEAVNLLFLTITIPVTVYNICAVFYRSFGGLWEQGKRRCGLTQGTAFPGLFEAADDIIARMNREAFHEMVRDVLLSIQDFVALEKHPIGDLIPRADPAAHRAEAVRRFLWDGIDRLLPQSALQDSLDWRYYRILSGRYIEGLSMSELEHRLALGERQLRRMHNRAQIALADVLWERLTPLESEPVEAGPEMDEDLAFSVSLEALPLNRVLEETVRLFRPQLEARGGSLVMQISPDLPAVQADRILLRQVLLHLFNRIQQGWAGDEVYVSARPIPPTIALDIIAMATPAHANLDEDLRTNRTLAVGLERLNARLTSEIIDDPRRDSAASALVVPVRYRLELAIAAQVKVLVVDDHEPAIRIIQRYLNPTGIQVVGLSDPLRIMEQVRALRPQAVLLDVMMPSMDGWEILQTLKSDPETRLIPVIVCSVWEQPDLAYSLGANGFLKKPINQAELVAELAHSHLLDTSGESPLTMS